MTADEWAGIALLIDEGWPGEFGDDAEIAWRMFLDSEPVDVVLAALRRLVLRGGTFRPSIAEVVAEIHHDPSAPTFDEMVTLIFDRGGVLAARTRVSKGSWKAGERERLDRDAQLERAAGMHPLIGAFVERQGLTYLRTLNLADEEHGGARRHALKLAWDAHVEAMRDRDVAALAAGRRRGDLGRLDPLAALGVQAPATVTQLGAGERA